MATKTPNPYKHLLSISDLYFEDLLNTPDNELLDEDSNHVSFAKNAYEAALQIVGKQRLQKAQAAKKTHSFNTTSFDLTKLTPQEARLLLSKAANNPQNTLAARNLQQITDAEVMDILSDINKLGGLEDL